MCVYNVKKYIFINNNIIIIIIIIKQKRVFNKWLKQVWQSTLTETRKKKKKTFCCGKNTQNPNIPINNCCVFCCFRVLEKDLVGQSLRRFKNFKAFQRQDSLLQSIEGQGRPRFLQAECKTEGWRCQLIVWLLIPEGTNKNDLFPKMYRGQICNLVALENGWLECDRFLFGPCLFSGAFDVSFQGV